MDLKVESYSHAILVIHPSLLYDAQRAEGVKFRPIGVNHVQGDREDVDRIESNANFRNVEGRICVLWDVSHYSRINVFRPIVGLISEDSSFKNWVESTAFDNLDRYANIVPFLSLLPFGTSDSKWQQAVSDFFMEPFGDPQHGRFCSELIMRCYRHVGIELFPAETMPDNVPPVHLASCDKLEKLDGAIIDDYGDDIARDVLSLTSFWQHQHYGRLASHIDHGFFLLDDVRKLILEGIHNDIMASRAYQAANEGMDTAAMEANAHRRLRDQQVDWAEQIYNFELPKYKAWKALNNLT